MKFKKKLVSKIKELREKEDIKQQELAEMVDVSRQTIYYLEKGSYNPSLTLSLKISEVFEKPIEDIFYFEPIIRDIIRKKTYEELEEISKESGIEKDKIMRIPDMTDKDLENSFVEEELRRLSETLDEDFENLFNIES
jgi:putative transcriptional regulator